MAPNNMKVKRKYVELSVAQKLQLIEKLEQGTSVTEVCNMYGIHSTTVSRIRKSKPKLQKFFLTHNIDSSKLHASTIGNKIRINFGPNKNLDKALYKWYSQQRSSGINVQQHQLRSEFSALVTRMGLSIKHTNHWLLNFKIRYGIKGSLRDAPCSEPSESEKKNSTEDKVIPEELIKVENLPSSSSSPPTTSTHRNISKLNASTIRNKKRLQHSKNANLDKALYKWYNQQRSSGINVQQLQLRSEFNALLTRMGLSIKDTNNWLHRFKKRHGIMNSLLDAPCNEPSESEKKNGTEDKVIPEEPIKVENLPSSSSSPQTTPTPAKNFGESVKVENSSLESCSSPTDVYQNYVCISVKWSVRNREFRDPSMLCAP
ncbi:PREDICTED: jerky protein homolog-like [Vollenhovia emeryi]|uniref:jerky protein homolog-like n=1 Tax=Vollenhovia emeryi TaxID=411798 RepID=UPI0005F4CA08|nr:PREDICTED: jerky protein homolog-like [Vollenhovia emeryi]